MLGVVEDEDKTLAGNRFGENVADVPSGLLGDPEGSRRCRRHDRGIAKRRERHPPHTVRELVGGFGDCLQRKAGFPRAARPGERDEAHVATRDELDDLPHLRVAAEERCRRNGQVRPIERSERGKVAGTELEHPLLRGKILEAVQSQIEQLAAASELCRRG